MKFEFLLHTGISALPDAGNAQTVLFPFCCTIYRFTQIISKFSYKIEAPALDKFKTIVIKFNYKDIL